ncbi:hypothetical protein EYF80_024547 [Liparis tanakae]|uniref:Uncharacterized protein n=1 Tax=Liparis tanakae TaxID=230148 RepID=A0A4Z2HHC4_9TELE|nr:hypothetical protein EYF80_024547 [Liparis tanakae]
MTARLYGLVELSVDRVVSRESAQNEGAEVQGEVLHEVAGVVTKRLSGETEGQEVNPLYFMYETETMEKGAWPHPAVERVQQRVSRPVRHAAAAVGLAAFSKFETLTSERPLVDLPIFSAAERHAEVLQLEQSSVSLRRGRTTTDGVRPGGEELGDARRVEAGLGQTERRPESSSSSADHHSIELMIHHRVLGGDLTAMKERGDGVMAAH